MEELLRNYNNLKNLALQVIDRYDLRQFELCKGILIEEIDGRNMQFQFIISDIIKDFTKTDLLDLEEDEVQEFENGWRKQFNTVTGDASLGIGIEKFGHKNRVFQIRIQVIENPKFYWSTIEEDESFRDLAGNKIDPSNN